MELLSVAKGNHDRQQGNDHANADRHLITGYVTDYGMLMCGVLFCSIPTMIVFFVLQKQFAEGITGAVK